MSKNQTKGGICRQKTGSRPSFRGLSGQASEQERPAGPRVLPIILCGSRINSQTGPALFVFCQNLYNFVPLKAGAESCPASE